MRLVTAESHSFNQRLSHTLFGLQDALDIDAPVFSLMIGVSGIRYHELRTGRSEVSVQELYTLAQGLDVNFGQLMEGQLDLKLLRQRLRGGPDLLPEAYADKNHHFARSITPKVIHTHLATYHGSAFARSLFRRLHVTPELFENLTDYISPMIPGDILNHLCEEERYTDEQIRGIGTMTFPIMPRAVSETLRNLRTPQRLYQYMFEIVVRQMYDRFSNYQIEQMTEAYCRMKVTISDEAQTAFGRKIVDYRACCLYRQGVMSSFLAHLTGNFAKVREHSCLYRGDPHCSFDIDWDNQLSVNNL
ncbi:hypothetical protein WDW86_22695 [Bdellovibrionota bacterium FG-2]